MNRCHIYAHSQSKLVAREREKSLRRIGICILNTSLWGARDDKWTAHDGLPSLPDFFTSPTAVAFAHRRRLTSSRWFPTGFNDQWFFSIDGWRFLNAMVERSPTGFVKYFFDTESESTRRATWKNATSIISLSFETAHFKL